MGSGKSTHGKKLASVLKYAFVDLDEYIQKSENKTIQFIFDHEGEEIFRDLEKKYLTELINKSENLVISLGGGTVCFNNNIELVKKNGLLIYIEMSPHSLADRLEKSRQKRPLLKKIPADQLFSFIEQKLSERNKYYHQAHLIMKGENLNYLELHRRIMENKRSENAV
jgi:shikimate kinase